MLKKCKAGAGRVGRPSLAQTRPNSLPLSLSWTVGLSRSLARLARWARDSGRWTWSPRAKGGDAAGKTLGVWAPEPLEQPSGGGDAPLDAARLVWGREVLVKSNQVHQVITDKVAIECSMQQCQRSTDKPATDNIKEKEHAHQRHHHTTISNPTHLALWRGTHGSAQQLAQATQGLGEYLLV